MKKAEDRDDWDEHQRLSRNIAELKRTSGNVRVPLSQIVEQEPSKGGASISAMMQGLIDLGVHPTDDAGIQEIKELPWSALFEWNRDHARYTWRSGGIDADKLAAARTEVYSAQNPHIDEVLFSKTYFALEETGLGYPNFVPAGVSGS